VRAGVLASSNPEMFRYGNFTEWKTVGDGAMTSELGGEGVWHLHYGVN